MNKVKKVIAKKDDKEIKTEEKTEVLAPLPTDHTQHPEYDPELNDSKQRWLRQ